MTTPPRLIGRKEAAAYCGIAESTFSLWVAKGKAPPTVPGTSKWDKRAIDALLNAFSGLGEPPAGIAKTDLQAQRDNVDRPRFGLDAKSENILVAMSYNTELNTLDVLPGAGPVMMGRLVGKGLVKCETAQGQKRYLITDEGHAEANRIFDSWKRR